MAFWRNVDCWIFVPDQGRLPLLDCKEGFRISRWPHSCLEKALPAWAEAHELLNPFICHSQRAGWDERKRGPGFLVGFSKPDHHAFTRLHSTQIPERKCCMKSMLSLVTIYHEGKIQMFQCLSLQLRYESFTLILILRSWVALSFKCEWVSKASPFQISTFCNIYKSMNVLYWPSIINYQLLPTHSVLYWPSTQLHHLVTHSWANWI